MHEESTVIDEVSSHQLESELISDIDLQKTPSYCRSFSKANTFGRMTPGIQKLKPLLLQTGGYPSLRETPQHKEKKHKLYQKTVKLLTSQMKNSEFLNRARNNSDLLMVT